MRKITKRGRPTKAPKAGERVPLGLRVTADTKRNLDAAAKHSGRSQSQEAEFRLDLSFEHDATFGQSDLRHVAILMAVSFEAAGRSMEHSLGITGDWTANPDCYLAAATSVAEVLWTRAPQDARDPEKARLYVEAFMGRVARH
jgi:hypothetical protein